MQCNTQAVNVTTNHKVKIDFTLPALSATNVVTWRCHVDDSAKGGYNMVLGRDILKELVLNLKLSEHVIKADDGPLNGSTTSMVDLGTYIFTGLNTGKISPEGSFTNAYFVEVYESEHVCNSTKVLRVILDAKYEKAYLHQVMKSQVQQLTMTQCN